MDQGRKENRSSRAAAYVRMSADHQQYSLDNQLEAIREFARRSELEIVRVYSDEGRSGLTIQGRAALAQLLAEVLGKKADFAHILVYDVSRWGRFQDPDEAAHYEFICRQAGVAVHFCAEQFENDGALASAISKSLKRVMAGEFSRELSAKVFQGASHLIQLGYKQGGSAIMGLRRMLVDQNGRPKGLLKNGELKSLQSDRVILVPGPEAEIRVVRWVFEAFVNERKRATEIGRLLNQRGILSASGCPWSEVKVRNLLRNENYIGNLVYARRSMKLMGRSVPNPPEKWVRGENAFPGIVPRELFFKAREKFESRGQRYKYTRAELLDNLRSLIGRHGRITGDLIKRTSPAAKIQPYRGRFGSLSNAYRLVGYRPERNYRPEIKPRRNQLSRELISGIIRQMEDAGATVTWDGRRNQLRLNHEISVWVSFVRHALNKTGDSCWFVHGNPGTDLTLAVRLDRNNEAIHDYYLLPRMHYAKKKIYLNERNGIYLDIYRHQNLDFLVGMAARVKMPEVPATFS